MILHIYANFNVAGEFFGSPIVEKITPEEMLKDYGQMLAGLDDSVLKKLVECDLYCLGSYDNVSGEIISRKEFLLHCGEVASRFIKNEVKKEEANA